MNLGNKRLQERFDDPEITGQNVGARLAEKAAQGRQQFSNMIRQSPSTQINQILAKNREATQNWNRVQAMQQGQGNNMTMRRRTSDPRPGPYRVPGPSMPPGLPGGGYNQAPPARRPTVDTSPTADAEVGRRRVSGYPMPAQPYFPPAPQSSPSPQAGLDPRNRPSSATPTGIQGIPPQEGPPQIAEQGPTPSYASQAPMGSVMPNFTAQAQNPFAAAMTQMGLLNQTNTGRPQRMGGNINRPDFTYGLNPTSPMWQGPYDRANDPFNYYWDSPFLGRDNVLPQFQGLPESDEYGPFANEGVARQWPGWEMTPEVMSGLVQQYGNPGNDWNVGGQLKWGHGVMPFPSSSREAVQTELTQQGLQQPRPTPFGVPWRR